MTTVLADARLGVMVADSALSDGDRQWAGRKVWRVKDELVGVAGNWSECLQIFQWYKGGMRTTAPRFKNVSMLVLSPRGLVVMDQDLVPQAVESGREAIGSGAKAAMCAYEALAWKDPRKAVQIVCRHDAGSRAPVRVYSLKKHGSTR